MAAAVTTQKAVNAAFPHGVLVVTDEMHFRMTKPEIKEHEENTYGLGWALPNKDMEFAFESIEERGDDWIVQANGKKYRFSPLDQEEGKKLLATMKEL